MHLGPGAVRAELGVHEDGHAVSAENGDGAEVLWEDALHLPVAVEVAHGEVVVVGAGVVEGLAQIGVLGVVVWPALLDRAVTFVDVHVGLAAPVGERGEDDHLVDAVGVHVGTGDTPDVGLQAHRLRPAGKHLPAAVEDVHHAPIIGEDDVRCPVAVNVTDHGTGEVASRARGRPQTFARRRVDDELVPDGDDDFSLPVVVDVRDDG